MDISTQVASGEQKELFDLISVFTENVVTELLSVAYRTYGPYTLSSDLTPNILVKVAKMYFNKCAVDISARNDPYLNEKFDEMLKTSCGQQMHFIDLLQIIVMMTLSIMNSMNLSLVLSKDYEKTMQLMTLQIKKLVILRAHLASGLQPCNVTHDKISPDDKIFEINICKDKHL